MSAATQKPIGELPRATPSFSYAQAAKGRSPSGPPSVSTEKATKEDQNSSPTDASAAQNKDLTNTAGTTPDKRAASEGSQPRHSNSKPAPQIEPVTQGNAGPSTNLAAGTPATQASVQSHVMISSPSSPEFGVTSASTLLKDDDLFSNANASSDSTWEKLSQSSQNGNKLNDKVGVEKEAAPNGPWDVESSVAPPAPALKEAPPPAVNFWQKRIEAKAAKQFPKPSINNSSNQEMNMSNPNGVTKPFDIGAESRKHDSKKQAKHGHSPFDDKPATTGAKDDIKIEEGRAKDEMSEIRSQRAARTPHVDKSAKESIPPPPPPEDALSWPTPDSAQDEGKKKAHERAERGEKEKPVTAKTHGKEKWMPVPYVPSVQFNTPIPTVRRGARAPRGGRDSGPRGGPLGADKARAEASETSTTSQAVGSGRGKTDVVAPKNAANSNRPKRASSAGPPLTRDQRKGVDSKAVENHKESEFSASRTGHQNRAPASEARRASATTHDEDSRIRRLTEDLPEGEIAGAMRDSSLHKADTSHTATLETSTTQLQYENVKVDQIEVEVDIVPEMLAIILSLNRTTPMDMDFRHHTLRHQCRPRLTRIMNVTIPNYQSRTTTHPRLQGVTSGPGPDLTWLIR
ncbi:MAG: hypothetical protein Q9219_000480 [cf. Caloplaca sp. 3 TL-2023]